MNIPCFPNLYSSASIYSPATPTYMYIRQWPPFFGPWHNIWQYNIKLPDIWYILYVTSFIEPRLRPATFHCKISSGLICITIHSIRPITFKRMVMTDRSLCLYTLESLHGGESLELTELEVYLCRCALYLIFGQGFLWWAEIVPEKKKRIRVFFAVVFFLSCLETGKVYAQYTGVSWNGLHIYILQYMSAEWSETIKAHLFLKGTTWCLCT